MPKASAGEQKKKKEKKTKKPKTYIFILKTQKWYPSEAVHWEEVDSLKLLQQFSNAVLTAESEVHSAGE